MTEPADTADRRAGFTLVELLVSMAVLALVALVMVAGLRFVVRAVASTDNRREAMEELTLGLSVLRGELERAEPLMVKVGNRDLVLFSGMADRLRFANVEPPYLAGPPYLAYEYAVTPDCGAYRIELRRVALDPDQPDLAAVEAGEPRTILRVAQRAAVHLLGQARRPREAPAWHEEWPAGPTPARGDPSRRGRGSGLARSGGAAADHGALVLRRRGVPAPARLAAPGAVVAMKAIGGMPVLGRVVLGKRAGNAALGTAGLASTAAPARTGGPGKPAARLGEMATGTAAPGTAA